MKSSATTDWARPAWQSTSTCWPAFTVCTLFVGSVVLCLTAFGRSLLFLFAVPWQSLERSFTLLSTLCALTSPLDCILSLTSPVFILSSFFCLSRVLTSGRSGEKQRATFEPNGDKLSSFFKKASKDVLNNCLMMLMLMLAKVLNKVYNVPILKDEPAMNALCICSLLGDCLKVIKCLLSLSLTLGSLRNLRVSWSTFDIVDSCLQSAVDNDRRCALPSATALFATHCLTHSTSFRMVSVTASISLSIAQLSTGRQSCRQRGWRMSSASSSWDPCPPDINDRLPVYALSLRSHESVSESVHCETKTMLQALTWGKCATSSVRH